MQRSPSSPHSPAAHHPRPLTPLSYLSSPVPDLASTLYSQAAEEADEANVSFLRDSLESLDHVSHGSRRSQVDPQRDPRRASPQEAGLANGRSTAAHGGQETTGESDLSRRARLHARLDRLHDPVASSMSAYSNRIPSPQHRQSLYDWAPGYDEHHDRNINDNHEEDDLDVILSELRRQQPDTHPDILRVLSQSQSAGQPRPRQREGDGLSAPAGAADTAERRDRLRERERRRRESEWVSLRTRAAIQRSRQEGSPSATDRMLRYVMERERSGMSEEEERARGSGWFRPSPSRVAAGDELRNATPSRDSWLLPPPANETSDRDRQERVEAFRRGYLAENVPPRLPRISTPPAPVTSNPPGAGLIFLENALKYLSELRYEEALPTAIDYGLKSLAEKHDDFVMDLGEKAPLSSSSWLQPGSVFEGDQHATSGIAGLGHRSNAVAPAMEHVNLRPRPLAPEATTSAGFDHPPGSTRVVSLDPSRPYTRFISPTSESPAEPRGKPPPNFEHDHWPVRVIVHCVDPDTMTLQGTMEAYDVPQHPASLSIHSADRPKAGRRNAPITTYLEGHIIDLTTHSFLTPGNAPSRKKGRRQPAADGQHTANPPTPETTTSIAFPAANAFTDATNWRKLPPFSHLASDEECARLLLSRTRMRDVHEQYVFMRWKERCFVHARDDQCAEADRHSDQDRGHGLTISGFYYVSLRRSDGVVEGLYYDPTSTPYQHLRLKGVGCGWPSCGFR